MRQATTLTFALSLLLVGSAFGQQAEYSLTFPNSEDITAPYTTGLQSGARGVSGPFDLDNDGKQEVLVTDYTGGGRVHVVEAQGPNQWEYVYSTPWVDSTASSSNARYATGADLDDDGMQEIIFIAGNAYNQANRDAGYSFGLYVYEFTGEDNDYGDRPASINPLDAPEIGPPASGSSEYLEALDIDGDGTQEVVIPLNSASSHDHIYVYSVSGNYEPSGLGTTFEAWVLEFRAGPRENGNLFGGGSPILAYPADLDGDGSWELSFQVWNNYNFFNADVTGENSYALADANNENRFYKAAAYDNAALVAGTVVDINQDGDDEVFYPEYDAAAPPDQQTLNVSLLNYEDGEDVLSITADNLTYNFLGPLSELGLDHGDLDGDGNMELLGTGKFGYTASEYNDGIPSRYLHIAEFTAGTGGNPEDAANYEITQIDTGTPSDTLGFNIVYRDSLGTTSRYYATNAGGFFAVKLANLGDADEDGNLEVAFAIQGTDDSLSVIDEVWNADSSRFEQTVRERIAIDARPFMHILEFTPDFSVAKEDRADVPSGFQLSANFPNPFNPTTTFSFTLPVSETVSVRVYDAMGRLIKTLVDGVHFSSGTHQVSWNGTDGAGAGVASGTYFYSLEYGSRRQVRSMVLLK